MSDRSADSPQDRAPGGVEMSVEQLRALQHGVAAILMPVSDGWRVHYFSLPDFDAEPGTTFPTFQQAVAALEEVLPAINSEAQRAEAQQELLLRENPSARKLAQSE